MGSEETIENKEEEQQPVRVRNCGGGSTGGASLGVKLGVRTRGWQLMDGLMDGVGDGTVRQSDSGHASSHSLPQLRLL